MPFTAGWNWNPQQASYLKNGKAVSNDNIRKLVNTVTNLHGSKLRQLVIDLKKEEITLDQFRNLAASEISLGHQSISTIAVGGLENIEPNYINFIEQETEKQVGFFDNLVDRIDQGNVRIDGRLLSRMDQYAGHSRSTYYNVQRKYRKEKLGDNEERRLLSPSEHCTECVDFAAMGWKAIGSLPEIGNSLCGNNCLCTFAYRNRKQGPKPKKAPKQKALSKRRKQSTGQTAQQRTFTRVQETDNTIVPTDEIPKPKIQDAITQIENLTFSGKLNELGEQARKRIKKGIKNEDDLKEVGRILAKDLREEIGDIENELDELEQKLRKTTDKVAKKGGSKKAPLDDVKEYNKLQRQHEQLRNTVAKKRQQAILNRLKQVRDMGHERNHELTSLAKSSKNQKQRILARKAVQDAERFFPKDWLESSIKKGKMKFNVARRGSYTPGSEELIISGNNQEERLACSIHELMHRMEFSVDGLRQREKEFFQRRIKGYERKKIYAGTKEFGYKDEFTEHYIGKDYEGTAYEVMTMGYEGLLTGKYSVTKDADLVEFVLGSIAAL